MISKLSYRVLPLVYTLAPYLALAAVPNETALSSRVTTLKTTINTVIGFLFVLATLIFLWGVIRYVVSGDEKSKEAGKHIMTWGIIGLAIMASVWGIANILIDYFGVGGATIPNTPTQSS